MAKVIGDFSSLQGRVGLFGGTFDPVHKGHLELARKVRAQLQLDHFVFLPAFRNPLKPNPGANIEQRLAMLELALQDEAGCCICTWELDQQVIYSIDTVIALREQAKAVTKVLLLHGSDGLQSFSKWHRVQELLSMVEFVIVERKGLASQERDAWSELLTGREFLTLYLDLPDISASAIRSNIKGGQPFKQYLSDAVLEYIVKQRLYI